MSRGCGGWVRDLIVQDVIVSGEDLLRLLLLLDDYWVQVLGEEVVLEGQHHPLASGNLGPADHRHLVNPHLALLVHREDQLLAATREADDLAAAVAGGERLWRDSLAQQEVVGDDLFGQSLVP